jgi:hypothetical protein
VQRVDAPKAEGVAARFSFLGGDRATTLGIAGLARYVGGNALVDASTSGR